MIYDTSPVPGTVVSDLGHGVTVVERNPPRTEGMTWIAPYSLNCAEHGWIVSRRTAEECGTEGRAHILADRFGRAADRAHAARGLALRPSRERDAELMAYVAMMRTASVMLRSYSHSTASVAAHVTLWRDRSAGQVRELRGGATSPVPVEYWAQHGRMDACEEILSDLEAELLAAV